MTYKVKAAMIVVSTAGTRRYLDKDALVPQDVPAADLKRLLRRGLIVQAANRPTADEQAEADARAKAEAEAVAAKAKADADAAAAKAEADAAAVKAEADAATAKKSSK